MTTLKTWLKRTAALSVVGLGALAVGAPRAEAGTLTATLTVQTTVTTACTSFTGNTMTFPSYIPGPTAPAVTANTTFGITCPGATAGTPDFVTISLAPAGGSYQMTSGANTLAYSLYQDSADTVAWPAATAENFTISTGAATTIPVYGQIAGALSPAQGAYSQAVTATLTY